MKGRIAVEELATASALAGTGFGFLAGGHVVILPRQTITSNNSPDLQYDGQVAEWSFLTKHARALLLIAEQADARLRDIASALDVTERTAYGVVADLTEAGYVVKEREGRRNRYQIQHHLPLDDQIGRERKIGELLALFDDATPRQASPQGRR